MIKVQQQQQLQVPPGTKIYLVNPESLRHTLHQSFEVGNSNGKLQETKVFTTPKVFSERKDKKRKVETVDLSCEDEEDIVYSKIFGRETTTRTGRISKSRFMNGLKPIKSSSSSSETSTEQSNGIKVKKREPASVFRCPTCQKVYIGFSKLNLHFRKFPDHYNYNNKGDSVNSHKTVPSAMQLKKNNSTSTSQSSKFLHCETQTEGCINSSTKVPTKVDVQIQVSTMPSTPDSEVAKILSPPLRELNTVKSDNYSFVPSLLLPNDESDNLCLQTTTTSGAESSSHRPPHHRSTTGSNDFCSQNFSPYRNSHHHHHNDNNSNNTSSSHGLGEINGMMGSIFDNTLRHLLRHSSSVGNSNNINTTSPRQCTSTEHSTSHGHNNNNTPPSSSTSPSTTSTKHNNTNHSEIPHHFASSIQKRAWDLIEEKMSHQGINEILLELTDVADKLAKIARDKIIPIREEEEERLRLNSNVPIVQVDSPFLSHLLDLPFGTYMFKEDLGIRRLLPPPVSAELSLTGGEEVDVGKFLTPDIDLMNLPHLTNIDFAEICSINNINR